MDFNADSEIIIVSNRAPITDFKNGNSKVSIGGLASALHRVAKANSTNWVFASNTFGYQMLDFESPKDLGYKLSPVTINNKEYKGYYEGFCNSLIWPLFHYFPEKSSFKEDDWKHYQNVNKKFAAHILEITKGKPNTKIWIQDYHLFLLPKYLRNLGIKNPIGFFLHIPFPTYEIFRLIPWRKEILESLLNTDLLGLHTKSYVSNFQRSVYNFIKDSSVSHDGFYISYKDHKSYIMNFPISIDSHEIKDIINSPQTKQNTEKLRQSIKSKFIGLGVDRLDYSKGIFERLKAIEHFFIKNPRYKKKMTFIQIAVPSRTVVPGYQKIKLEIEEIISRINGNYGTLDWQPIIYINRSIPFEQLTNFYQIADFALITPLRDGMNLVAKEYIAAQNKGKGALILSELAGAAEELAKVQLVNPYNQEQIANAIKYCIENPQPQSKILEQYKESILINDVYKWASKFCKELDQIREQRLCRYH